MGIRGGCSSGRDEVKNSHQASKVLKWRVHKWQSVPGIFLKFKREMVEFETINDLRPLVTFEQ